MRCIAGLIALQVNNWNEYRKDRILEKRVLEDLAENLELNIKKLEFWMESNERHDWSSDVVSSALERKLPYHDSLDNHFGWASTIEHRPSLSVIGYESLKNVGVEIISNHQLKKEIIYLFEQEYRNTQTRIERLEPQNIEYAKLRQERFMRKRGFRFSPFEYTQLLTDEYFQSWLITIRNNRKWFSMSFEESQEESQRVLQLLKKELRES